ncbi:MarR family transcriptional regulator [Microbispora sp. NEAU-D428]|uniref:MarR family winged helix-turn-helix transcriptional regulator n=1 Tax=Microbispora sitophila TaxID=2771537 RepID=UPI00186730CA|nr:helix-turn-helix domain-containing protein [Microbispora sitophila]MBE3015739.1 MarR family transcriptional regulator [Microbispora sitophila]
MDRLAVLRDLMPALRDTSRTLLRTGVVRSGLEPLPASEADMIRAIVREPGVSPGRLAAELQMKPSNVSTALRHLAELGLVQRESDSADRRAGRVLPTPKAVAGSRRIEETWAKVLDEVLAELPDHQAQALLDAVPALRALERALRTRDTAAQDGSR